MAAQERLVRAAVDALADLWCQQTVRIDLIGKPRAEVGYFREGIADDGRNFGCRDILSLEPLALLGLGDHARHGGHLIDAEGRDVALRFGALAPENRVRSSGA